MIRSIRLAALALTAILGSPFIQARAAVDDATALYAKAGKKGEAQIVVYTPYSNLQPVWDRFSKAYPAITVQTVVIPGGGAPLLGRIAAEAASGNYISDLVLTGFSDIANLAGEGKLERDEPAEAATLDAQFKAPDGLFQVPFTTLFTIVYNPRLIKDDDLPRSLDEAISPKWAGKFGYARYTGAAASDLVGTILAYNDAISDTQLKAIKSNGLTAPNNATLISNVAQGRVPFGLWGPTQNVGPLQKDGAPIAVKYLPDSSTVMGPGLSLLKKAPHPNAARLLKGWILSVSGQAALAEEAASYGTQPGTPAPPGLPELVGYRFKGVPLTEYEARSAAFRVRTLAIFGP